MPFQLAAILLLSAISYHLVENPLRRANWIGGARGAVAIGLSVACLASVLLLGEQVYSIPAFSGDQTAEVERGAPVPGYVTKYSKRKIDDCFAASFLGTNKRSLGSNLDRCTAEAKVAAKLIFVGDSHATDMFPMADRIYRDGVASVVNVSQPGCRAPRLEKEGSVCDYVDSIMNLVAQTGPGSNTLVIRNNYSPRYVDGSLHDFSTRLEKLLNHASALGMKVVYIAPSPKYYAVGPGSLCSRQWYRPAWAMDDKCHSGFAEDRVEQLARRRDVTNYLLDLSRQRKDFFVFDPFDALCGGTEGSCSPLRDGRLIYRDSSHLTEEGSELLADPFEDFLRRHKLL